MPDYSSASDNAQDALADAADGLVEEYQVSKSGHRVKRGRVADQIQAAAMLEGLAARRAAGGIFKLAKRKNPR